MIGTISEPVHDDGPELYTVEEVAKRLKVSRTKVYALIAANEMPSFLVPLSRLRRVSADDLREWIGRASGRTAA